MFPGTETTGISPKGDAAWLWVSEIRYTYFVDDSLDISNDTFNYYNLTVEISSVTFTIGPVYLQLNNNKKNQRVKFKNLTLFFPFFGVIIMANYEKLVKFLGKKIVRFIILLIFVILLSFLLIDASPINPVKSYISNMVVSPEQVAKLEAYWGVNEPITSKMVNWLGNIVKGDFGTSLIFRMPVIDVIKERFTASLVLMLTSWIFSGVFGFF